MKKWTKREIRKIKTLRKHGTPTKEIANIFNVKEHIITNLCKKHKLKLIKKKKKTKICTVCHKHKRFSSFYINKGGVLYSKCKECWYIKTRSPKRLEYYKKYRKKYYIENIEELKQYSKNYHKNKENRKKVNKRLKYRHKNDPEFRLYNLLRCRMRHAIDKSHKSNSTEELLGCSLKEFRIYIESKFIEGMSWDNHGNGRGKWNIDHIIPCRIFNLTDNKQQKICFNYKNLEPKWWKDNFIKADYLDNGRRARDMSKEERLEYLKAKGFEL